ncbi:MAG: FKBP-type peptidyl-prolyl cis-trans isomerase [Pseudomonadota bacterium]
MSETIDRGSRVTLRYTLSLEDGTVVETTEGFEPLTFTIGDGTLIAGLEAVVKGLKAGDKQCLQIDPREGFGYPDVGNVHFLPRERFPADVEPQPGLIVGFETPGGEELPGTVLEVDEDQVRVDFNHPLAGRTITFDVEVEAVEPADA